MSLLVVGLSHRSASVDLLESASIVGDRGHELDAQLGAGEHVNEWLVLSTCNRVEVYADAATFHGSVVQITDALAQVTGIEVEQLRESLYVHFDDRAVAHLFTVAAGLDSLAVGESQILGQLRASLQAGRSHGHLSTVLESVAQQALRVGKRVHSETDIDAVSRSLVQRGLDLAADRLGPLTQSRTTVVGAGAMSSLTAHTLHRLGVEQLTIVNRTDAKAEHLAAALGAQHRPWSELTDVLATSDLVVTCTGAVGHVIEPDMVATGRTQVFLDLALPRDVDPAVENIDGVTVVSLEHLQQAAEGQAHLADVDEMVTAEVAEYLTRRKAAAVGPTVAALRAYAADVVATELDRLETRVDLDERTRAQVELTVHRVVEKLLHTPTVRMKELATGDADLAALVRSLFDLDPHSSRVAQIPPEVSGV